MLTFKSPEDISKLPENHPAAEPLASPLHRFPQCGFLGTLYEEADGPIPSRIHLNPYGSPHDLKSGQPLEVNLI